MYFINYYYYIQVQTPTLRTNTSAFSCEVISCHVFKHMRVLRKCKQMLYIILKCSNISECPAKLTFCFTKKSYFHKKIIPVCDNIRDLSYTTTVV